MSLRFAGFDLDQERAELRAPDGGLIKLRRKTLGILKILSTSGGRVVSKQELMEAVWPNVVVGDDSLFQCIRELRTALGDDQRQLIKLVSGQGYVFTAEVSVAPATVSAPAIDISPVDAPVIAEAPPSRPLVLRRPVALIGAGLGAIVALVVLAVAIGRPNIIFSHNPTIAVMPVAAADSDGATLAMAENVTTRLADGLAKIENIGVSAPSAATQIPGASQADFVVRAELQKTERSWDVRARMIRSATGEIVWSAPISVRREDGDAPLQQTRLAAGIGHPLALRIGELLRADARTGGTGRHTPSHDADVAVQQAIDSITQITRERFEAAEAILKGALAEDPDNVDLSVSLTALQLRGIQMVWYSPTESAAARNNARSTLKHALQIEPTSVPVLEAYCRFLNATNQFVESLVACAKVLSFDPWDGLAIYHIGLTQLQLGRFEDALATFQQAERFDTPEVSRWTWLLGIGWVSLIMGRNEDAAQWLQKSIAITPASGRTYMLLAVACERLGRHDDAKAAMAKGMALRPGSTASNVPPPMDNVSSEYLRDSRRDVATMVEIGLPER